MSDFEHLRAERLEGGIVKVSFARAAVAAHGGIGYTWEFGLKYWFRRAAFDHAYLGSPSMHRARAADMAEW